MSLKNPIDTLFLILLWYFLIASSSVEFLLSERASDAYSLYFQGLLFVMAIGYGWVVRRAPHHATAFSWRNEWVPLLVLYLVFVVSRGMQLGDVIIWLDEHTQFTNAMSKEGISHALEAAMEQQPPLDYYLSAFIGHFLGFQMVAIKFHPLFFSLLMSVTLYISVVILTGQKWLGSVSAAGSLLLPIFVSYSLEARPQTLCLLSLVFVLHFFFRYLQTGERQFLYRLWVAESLFVHTIGFQPGVFLLILALSSLPMIFDRKTRPLFFHTFAVHSLTLIVFLPSLWKTVSISMGYNKFSGNIWQNLIEGLPQLGWSSYLKIYQPIGGFFLLLFVLIALVVATEFKKRKLQWGEAKLPLIALLFLLLFPIGFDLVFFSAINWRYSPRYHVVVYPMVLLAVAFFASVALKRYGSRKRLVALAIFALAGAAAQAYDYSSSRRPRTMVIDRGFVAPWKSIYSFLNQRLRPGDQVFLFDFHGLGDWMPSVFVAHQFFLEPKFHQNLVSHLWEDIRRSALGEGLAKEGESGQIFLILQVSRNDYDVLNALIQSPIPFYRQLWRQGVVLQFSSSAYENVPLLLQSMVERFPRRQSLSQAYEILIEWAWYTGQAELSQFYLEEFSQLEFNSSRTIEGSQVDKKRILQERVDYYRTLISGD